MKLKVSHIALATAAALAGTQAGAADVVKIGFAAPLTGPQSNYGTDMQKGVQLAMALLHKSSVRTK